MAGSPLDNSFDFETPLALVTIFAMVGTGVYKADHKECEASLKASQWAKNNPDSYVAAPSEGNISEFLGLAKFNAFASKHQLAQLAKQVKGFERCVNIMEAPPTQP